MFDLNEARVQELRDFRLGKTYSVRNGYEVASGDSARVDFLILLVFEDLAFNRGSVVHEYYFFFLLEDSGISIPFFDEGHGVGI
jgi:hypothetical protein